MQASKESLLNLKEAAKITGAFTRIIRKQFAQIRY